MKISTILAMILLSFSVALTQDVYTPVQAAGEMPEDFILKSSEKYNLAAEKLDGYSYNETKSRKEFLLQSNFSVDAMLHGGQILFNDSISNYVNNVVDVIYEHNTDLPDELRFYVMRSSATNAFSTNQGIVFVTSGLISQLENEAQLAFILCHEISHYIKKHTIQSFLESKQSSRNINNRSSYDAYVALMSKYSKSQEFEADSEGLNYFLKTPYDHDEAYTAFDVLHYSYLPFDEVPFDVDFFANDYFLVRNGVKIDSLNQIDVFNEDYDDSESSHPNVWKRKEKMDALLSDRGKKGGKWFVVGEDDFLGIQDLCRREGIRIDLLQGRYHKAIYSGYLLLNSNFDDEYAQISIAKALYGLQQHDAFGELREVLPRTKYIEGESSALVYFLNKLEEEELAVLAIQHLFKLSEKYPENNYYRALLEDAVYDLVNEQGLLYSDFKRKLPDVESDSLVIDHNEMSTDSLGLAEEEVKERRRSGKYGKIEEAKSEVITTEDGDMVISANEAVSYYRYALIPALKNAQFSAYFEQVSTDFVAEEEKEEALSSRDKWEKKRAALKAESRKEKRILTNGTNLGIEELILLDPDISIYNINAKKEYLASEAKTVSYTEQIMECAANEGLDYEIMSFESSSNADTEFYNSMSLLSAWSFEASSLEDIEVEMIPLEGEYINQMVEDTDKRYLAVTSLTYFPEKREIEGTTWAYSVVFLPFLPLTIAAAATRVKNNIHYLKVVDLETGRLIHRSYRNLKVKMNDKVLRGVAYDTVQQLSSTR